MRRGAFQHLLNGWAKTQGQKTSDFFLQLWGNWVGWTGEQREAECMVGEMVLGAFMVFVLPFLSNRGRVQFKNFSTLKYFTQIQIYRSIRNNNKVSRFGSSLSIIIVSVVHCPLSISHFISSNIKGHWAVSSVLLFSHAL